MFSKSNYSPAVVVEARHEWHAGVIFRFHFAKLLAQETLDAQRDYFGLTKPEEADAARKALINVVALMSVSEPEGFEDLPGSAQATRLAEIGARLDEIERTVARDIAGGDDARELSDEQRGKLGDERERLLREGSQLESELASIRSSKPLADRIREYFDDETKPELEQLAAAAWQRFTQGARPDAYLKSVSANGA